MKICLIIPPSGFLLDEKVFPSLGVLKVAAVLQREGHHVLVSDLSGRAASDWRWCVPAGYDAYGLTATMPQMPAACTITIGLRGREPHAKFILGGPHVTLLHASQRQERARGEVGRGSKAFSELEALFDVLVCGDGEAAIFEALQPNAPSVVNADDPASALFLKASELEEAPFPARQSLDIRSYRYQIDGVATMSLIAQLGCPFGCAFCGGRRSPFLRRVRMRSTASVIAEMREMYDTWGTRGFMFLDDELNVNKAFPDLLAQIIALQKDLGVTFRLRGLVKSELVTEPMAHQMYAAGFRQLLIGFESGDPRILLNMQKGATRDENTRCVELLHNAGLKVKALMSVGHAGESLETIQATEDWLLEVRPEDFDVTIITVYPGTPYYDDAREITPGVWTYVAPKTGDRLHAGAVDQLSDVNYYKGIPGQYQAFVWTDHVSAGELVSARDAVEAHVRKALRIPYPTSASALNFEHSMGMSA